MENQDIWQEPHMSDKQKVDKFIEKGGDSMEQMYKENRTKVSEEDRNNDEIDALFEDKPEGCELVFEIGSWTILKTDIKNSPIHESISHYQIRYFNKIVFFDVSYKEMEERRFKICLNHEGGL